VRERVRDMKSPTRQIKLNQPRRGLAQFELYSREISRQLPKEAERISRR
jgi:hypothetical protein